MALELIADSLMSRFGNYNLLEAKVSENFLPSIEVNRNRVKTYRKFFVGYAESTHLSTARTRI